MIMKKNLLLVLLICFNLAYFSASAQTPTTFWADNATTTWYNTTENAFDLTTAIQ